MSAENASMDQLLQNAIALCAKTSGARVWSQGAPLDTIAAFAQSKAQSASDPWMGLAKTVRSVRLWVTDMSDELVYGSLADDPRGSVLGDPPQNHPVRAWARLDRDLAREMHELGYLSHTPEVVTTMGNRATLGVSGGLAQFPYGLSQYGTLALQSDQSGAIPLTIVGPQAQDKILGRWQVLLHEAAHLEWAHLERVFAPTKSTPMGSLIDDDACERLNTWSLNRFSNSPGAGFLTEGFAEAYGAMMLLQRQNFSQESMDYIENMLLFRQKKAMGSKKDYDTHDGCAVALRVCLERIDQWKDAPPEKVKRIAVECASDALCEWADLAHAEKLAERDRWVRMGAFSISSGAPNNAWAGFCQAHALGFESRPEDVEKFLGNKPWKDYTLAVAALLQQPVKAEMDRIGLNAQTPAGAREHFDIHHGINGVFRAFDDALWPGEKPDPRADNKAHLRQPSTNGEMHKPTREHEQAYQRAVLFFKDHPEEIARLRELYETTQARLDHDVQEQNRWTLSVRKELGVRYHTKEELAQTTPQDYLGGGVGSRIGRWRGTQNPHSMDEARPGSGVKLG